MRRDNLGGETCYEKKKLDNCGSSGLSGVISVNRDKNVPTIVVSASQTADRRDIPVSLLMFQILLPHLTLKSQFL